jgi:RNA polymerase sigma-70 factor (ECF subfamily)
MSDADDELRLSATDRSLVRLIRAGDEPAAAELFERYAARTLGLARTQMADRLRRKYEPEDILQSVFKSIFRGIRTGAYDAPGEKSLWGLISIVTVHKVRKKARLQAAARRDDRRTVPLAGDHAELLNAAASPEQFEAAVQEILESLREAEQRVIRLRLEGETVETIAARLKLSRRSVERLLQRARESLADLLLNDDADREPPTAALDAETPGG